MSLDAAWGVCGWPTDLFVGGAFCFVRGFMVAFYVLIYVGYPLSCWVLGDVFKILDF